MDAECAFEIVVTDVEKDAFDAVITKVDEDAFEAVISGGGGGSSDSKAGVLIDTVSGSIASFVPDATVPTVKGLTVDIEPVQSGSGDPSPDNIRPISGWDSVDITRSGANLLPTYTNSVTQNGITYTANADGIVTVNGTATATNTYTAPLGTFAWDGAQDMWLSGCPTGGNYSNGYSLRLDGRNGGWSNPDIGNGIKLADYGTSVPIIGQKLRFCIVIRNGVVCNNLVFKPMLNFGNSALPYEEYKGMQTYTIPLGQTVYGGTVDATNGVLTVDRGYIASYNGETLPSTWISDRDVYASGTTPTIGAEVVYNLATPITIDLTPTEISVLTGQTNNIWADSGDVSVDYAADLKTYIDQKIAAAVAALS